MSKVALSFHNASCAHCVRTVTRLLGGEDGVASMEVDSAAGRLVVSFDSGRTSVGSICGLMERSGYPTRAIAAVDPLPHVGLRELGMAA